jgi:hypothetical protein
MTTKKDATSTSYWIRSVIAGGFAGGVVSASSFTSDYLSKIHVNVIVGQNSSRPIRQSQNLVSNPQPRLYSFYR